MYLSAEDKGNRLRLEGRPTFACRTVTVILRLFLAFGFARFGFAFSCPRHGCLGYEKPTLNGTLQWLPYLPAPYRHFWMLLPLFGYRQSAATRCRYGVESEAPTQSSQENAKACHD
jgi:hypothetical protein